jgi:uncharacterized membrane protein
MNIFGKVKISALWDALRTSYWFVPTLMAFASIVIWSVVYSLDMKLETEPARHAGWIYTGGPDGAREVLSVTAGSMITIAGVTFSITIVALTLASQQFGPFLLRNFMRDTGNQIVLGTFIATFIFCLLALRTVRGTDEVTFVPHLSVSVGLLLGMLSLGVLIYFIHHVSASIQASKIIAVVSRDLKEAIDRLFPEELGREADINSPEDSKIPEQFTSESGLVRIDDSGYIKAMDNESLLSFAGEHDIVIRLLKRPGDFVASDDVIAMVWPAETVSRPVSEKINEAFVIGAQRTATQDAEFVVNQLVEIAVRALSPSVNDPFTAVICIDHIGAGLRRLAGRAIPSPLRYDEDKVLRVIAFPNTFADILGTAFDQIRIYGKKSPVVTVRLLETIADIAEYVHREEDRSALLYQAEMIERGSRDGIEEKGDRDKIRNLYNRARKALSPDRIEV